MSRRNLLRAWRGIDLLSKERIGLNLGNNKEKIALSILFGLALVTIYGYSSTIISYVLSFDELPLHIKSVTFVDEYGVVRDTFEGGETLRINVSLITRTSDVTDYLLFILIMEGDAVIYQHHVSDFIESGKVKVHNIGYSIPEDAQSGSRTLSVNLWSNLLESGDIIADNSGYSRTFIVN